MQKLDPKVIWIFFFRFFFGAIVLFLFLSIWLTGFLANLEKGLTFFWLLIPFFILYLVFCWIWAKLSYRFWRYQLTEDVFKKEHGVIWKKYVSIPYDRIQNVDIYRGVIARILGLSNISIQTAGYGAVGGARRGFGGEGYLPGLDKNVAEELREELIKRAKGVKQGL